MIHEIVPFPFGSREGELVVRIAETGGTAPIDIAGAVATTYRNSTLQEVWLDVADVAGAGLPHKLGLELRKVWREIVVTGSVESATWPLFPCRLVVDVSEYLSSAVTDVDVWAEEVSKKLVRTPSGVAELYAVAPAAEMLHPDRLGVIESLISPLEGATLYVAEADVARAVRASTRASRPWVVRRLGALPPTSRAPAPAASPTA